MKEVQEKFLLGELGVSPRIPLSSFPPRVGARGLKKESIQTGTQVRPQT